MVMRPKRQAAGSTAHGGGYLVRNALFRMWVVLARALPEGAFWYPLWLGAVLWKGRSGRGASGARAAPRSP
ncbi:hypothetical protein [Streptomyces sp. NPDC048462]|uniref:hypothetical protein n=1 Tax=Streptomyces sp. NPDC048462 TaxID=3365555 RepID=UPI00371181BA